MRPDSSVLATTTACLPLHCHPSVCCLQPATDIATDQYQSWLATTAVLTVAPTRPHTMNQLHLNVQNTTHFNFSSKVKYFTIPPILQNIYWILMIDYCQEELTRTIMLVGLMVHYNCTNSTITLLIQSGKLSCINLLSALIHAIHEIFAW